MSKEKDRHWLEAVGKEVVPTRFLLYQTLNF